jgi:uncharacterized membrane protein YcaP (DUF421 family)
MNFFFNDWQGVLRVAAMGILAYAATVLFLRISGKRTLSKMNAFDLVVTVALGSTLATILLSDRVALLEGLTAIGLLIGLQFLITWMSIRSQLFQGLIKAQPRMLYYRDSYFEDAMRVERVTREEVMAAVRAQGHGDMTGIHSVVLETDGTISVLTGNASRESNSSLRNVLKPGDEKTGQD